LIGFVSHRRLFGGIDGFVSRAFSFNVEELLTPAKLEEINARRQNQNYISIESANEVKNGPSKPEINNSSPFCRFFEYGANKEGYWNYNHAALQLEDLVDCLCVLYPNFDFVFLFDQSSGHGKRQKDGLSVKLMNKHHAGAGPVMHPTVISEPSCLGPYPKILAVGETQSRVFQEGDDGPFYYTEVERHEKKYDRLTGNKKKRDLKKSELINLLQAKLGSSFKAQTYRSLEELKILANNNNIAVKVKEDKVNLGWLHKSKGLLQVLWEHGWINPSENINNYVKDKKQK